MHRKLATEAPAQSKNENNWYPSMMLQCSNTCSVFASKGAELTRQILNPRSLSPAAFLRTVPFYGRVAFGGCLNSQGIQGRMAFSWAKLVASLCFTSSIARRVLQQKIHHCHKFYAPYHFLHLRQGSHIHLHP